LTNAPTERRTEDGGLEGLVLGGKALTAEHIAREAGESVRSVRYHVKRLEYHGYIRRLVHHGLASGYSGDQVKEVSPHGSDSRAARSSHIVD